MDTNSGEATDYFAGFRDSTFCLAATGTGWGVRAKLALYYGCIPVVIADGVQVKGGLCAATNYYGNRVMTVELFGSSADCQAHSTNGTCQPAQSLYLWGIFYCYCYCSYYCYYFIIIFIVFASIVIIDDYVILIRHRIVAV